MRCFYHHQVEAVGSCKNCNKGLCPECAVDVGDGLACKGQCETKVQDHNTYIAKCLTMLRVSEESIIWGAIFIAILGLGFVLVGLYFFVNQDEFDWFFLFPLFMGLAMLGGTGYLYILKKRLEQS